MYDPTREQKPFEIKLGKKCFNVYTMPIKATMLYDEISKESARILARYTTIQELFKQVETIENEDEKKAFIEEHKKQLEEFTISTESFAKRKTRAINELLKYILQAADEEFDLEEWDTYLSENDKWSIVNAFVESKKKALLEGMKEKGL